MNRLITVVGPTAVGKSRLALYLAQRFAGEIINADSRQVYRYMDIGTAKPNREERALVPHHLIDIINPDQDFSLALYQPLARRAIADISQKSSIPLIVGGSGLYVWSLLEGWKIPAIPPQPHFRRQQEERAAQEGSRYIYAELVRIDPAAAAKIDPGNVRRIIRALEVYYATGIPFSQLQERNHLPFSFLIIGLTADRKELYRRIDLRVEEMVKKGLVEEVRSLVQKRGYSLSIPSMSSLGYKQIGMYLERKVDLAGAIQQIKFATHRFVRHQYSWFRLQDQRIHWFDVMKDTEASIARAVEKFLVDSGE